MTLETRAEIIQKATIYRAASDKLVGDEHKKERIEQIRYIAAAMMLTNQAFRLTDKQERRYKATAEEIKLALEEAETLVRGVLAVEQMERNAVTPKTDVTNPDIEALKMAAEKKKKHTDAAIEELKNGNPMDRIHKAYEFNHFGDKEVATAVIYASMLQSSATTKGLQIYLTGDKGVGKSSAMKAALHLVPNVLDTSFSSKALYYKPPLAKQSVVIDDAKLSEEQVTLLKRCITNFQCETKHLTVHNNEIKEMTIPKRILWFGTSVLEEGDDQFKDRFMVITLKNSKTDNEAYTKFEKKRRAECREELAVNDDVEVARAIIDEIHKHEFRVKGLESIVFADAHDRRLINIFLDLVEASAILHWMQREHEEKNGEIIITPDKRDIDNANGFSIFTFVDREAEGRLNRTEVEFSDLLQRRLGTATSVDLSISEIVDLWGRPYTTVHDMVYGRNGSATKPSGGIVSKAKWITIAEPVDRESKARSVIRVTTHKKEKPFDGFGYLPSQNESFDTKNTAPDQNAAITDPETHA